MIHDINIHIYALDHARERSLLVQVVMAMQAGAQGDRPILFMHFSMVTHAEAVVRNWRATPERANRREAKYLERFVAMWEEVCDADTWEDRWTRIREIVHAIDREETE